MKISNEEYSKMVDEVSKPSKVYKTFPLAFLVGGIICTIGEILRLTFIHFNLDKISANNWVSVTLIFLTALLTGLGLFEKIAKFGGAGCFVPITGFANSVVSPALEFKTEGFVLGLAAKMFVIAGPVIVYGTLASVVYGIIYFVLKLMGVM